MNTDKFTGKAEVYTKARPGYPDDAIEFIRAWCRLIRCLQTYHKQIERNRGPALVCTAHTSPRSQPRSADGDCRC